MWLVLHRLNIGGGLHPKDLAECLVLGGSDLKTLLGGTDYVKLRNAVQAVVNR